MNLKRFISLVVSVAILLYLYSQIEITELIKVFQTCDPLWMTLSLGMVIPLVLFTSWRLQQLMPHGTNLSFVEANRLILGSSVLNMILPSKMGDIAKAYFMQEKDGVSGTLSLSIVIFEKACDMLSLLLWCALGLIIYPNKDGFFWLMTAGIIGGLVLGIVLLSDRKIANLFFNLTSKITPKGISKKLHQMQNSWGEMHDYFWGDTKQLTLIATTSIFIWFLHLLQIWLFIIALKASTPFVASLALSPLSILAGLLPLTFAGIGTRDAALIFFYEPYLSATVGAALGLLCTSRYFLPAIIGLPFLGQMLATVKARTVNSKVRS
ncbi:MAG: lysylphosphatidylglycerol synthase transmembrane domain-containing protein [Xenococcaceae cyanobacterium MO_188.B19]|nr:lysylphosphatidylglycerol synthase transmembrane domain-containing protein [Xenococcaceae cyanobacterium MO_188.B19]